MSTFATKVLLALSRPVTGSDYPSGNQHWETRDPLETLTTVFPDLFTRIAGKRVLDFGCGEGYQAIAMAQRGARAVVGFDTMSDLFERTAVAMAGRVGAETPVTFTGTWPADDTYDVVVSLDCMEHVDDPSAVLTAIGEVLNPGGVALISFGPPWHAPYGAHMYFFTKVPWVHLLFSESTVMQARAQYREDGATRYREAGLGQLTVRRWERALQDQSSRFTVERISYTPIRDLPGVASVPVLRELCINNVATVLRKRG